MYWCNFLHIYQPHDQSPEILQKVVNESYRPIIQGLLDNPQAKVTLNINACLSELLLEHGYRDVIDNLITLARKKQLEFTASAKYHPFLPLLPIVEIKRQIELNEKTNRKIFGSCYRPFGFFPPEMGYHRKMARVIEKFGFSWIILDEIAYQGRVNTARFDRLYQIKDTSLKVFFRERRLSNLIMGALVRQPESVVKSLGQDLQTNNYLITAMDGETFGHHRPGLERLLVSLYNHPDLKLLNISELLAKYHNIDYIKPIASTWASSEEQIQKNKPYYLYFDRSNNLQVLQRRLINLVLKAFSTPMRPYPFMGKPRQLLDKALSCNHMWWANPEAWWSIEEIERGAYHLLSALYAAARRSDPAKPYYQKARSLYYQILALSFEWQRSGHISKLQARRLAWKRIPFKKRARPGEFKAIIEILKKEELRAAQNREYEQAIRWRDSIYKLENELDIYDLTHIVDQLRAEDKLNKYKELTDKYKKDYYHLAPGQPE